MNPPNPAVREALEARISLIQGMIKDFDRLAEELRVAADQEMQRSGIYSPDHYAFSTVAAAALKRRENLLASSTSMNAHLEKLQTELEDVVSTEKLLQVSEQLTAKVASNARRGKRPQRDRFADTILHASAL